jgi:hypothetical protein
MAIKDTVKNIKRSQIKTNTQRVAHRLLTADGEWVSRSRLDTIPSVAARIRDLRKDQFGAFQVECKTNTALGRKTKTGERVYYYRIDPTSVTEVQVKKVFKLV